MLEDFGKRVKKARKKAGYTQSQLAEMVDVSVNHISAIERGVYETRIDTLKKLSIVLGASTDYLIFGTPDEQGPLSKAVSKANRLSENDKVWVADYLEAILKVRNNSK